MREGGDELETPVDLRGFGNVLLWLVAIRAPDLVDGVYRAHRVRPLKKYGTVDDHYVPSPPLIGWLLTAAELGILPDGPPGSAENSANKAHSMKTQVSRAFNGEPDLFKPEWVATLARQCGFTPADLAVLKRSREQLLDGDGEIISVDAAALRRAIETTRRLMPAPASASNWPAPERAPAQREVPAAAAATRPVPRQLPAAVAQFVGRAGELAALNDLARGAADVGGAVVISAIGGTAGVGKTALAVHWAHRLAGLFPDGQLYVNLRGFDSGGQMLAPTEAVLGFLDAMGIPPEQAPLGLEAQAALYRSILADRRMLIVLDNARDSAQVRPLLPGAPGHLVLVTSRHRLSGLIADGARPVILDVLPLDDARELLATRIGANRAAAEATAVSELVTYCARLPLALAIVAARVATNVGFRLQAIADELRDSRMRLDALSGELSGDGTATDVRAVFLWSYRALTPAAARLFRFLGLHPGPDISVPAASSLLGCSAHEVQPLLAELASSYLIKEHSPGRYEFHDLLRAYAAEQAHTIDPDDQRHAAIRREFDYYLHTAYAASLRLEPYQDPITVAPPEPGSNHETPDDAEQALAWFTAEHRVLLSAARHAATVGLDVTAWQLPWTLSDFLDRRGRWSDLATVQSAALAVAQRLGDRHAQALAHRAIARAYAALGLADDALSHLEQALSLSIQAQDPVGQAHSHHNIAFVRGRQLRHADALKHSLEAMELYEAAGHARGQARALNAVGWYYAQLGEHRQAIAYCRQALTQHQKLGNLYGQAGAWDSLGYAHDQLGLPAAAVDCYTQALALYRALGDRWNEAETLTRLGDVHHASGDVGAARQAWLAAMAITNGLDLPDNAQTQAKLQMIAHDGQLEHPEPGDLRS